MQGPGQEEPSYQAAIAAYAPGVSSLLLERPCSEEENYPFQQVLGPLAPHVRRLQLVCMVAMPGLLQFLSTWPALEDVEVYEKESALPSGCWDGCGSFPHGLAAKVRRLETDVPGVAAVLPTLTALTELSLEAGSDLDPAQLARLLPPLRQLRSIIIDSAVQNPRSAPTDCDAIAATLSSLPHLQSCDLRSALCPKSACGVRACLPLPMAHGCPCTMYPAQRPFLSPPSPPPLLAAACLAMPSALQSPSCLAS
jgi:hypothetical protein